MQKHSAAANGKVKHILPASAKPDAENHGFGIANVRDTAQKYGGLLYIEQNGNRFTTILTIAKSCFAMAKSSFAINDGQDTQIYSDAK